MNATRAVLVPDLAATRIYLVRHGTTLLNRQHRYRGRLDVPLDEGGWQEAWKAAAELRDSKIQAIYSSPLRRARDTARVIADATGIATVVDQPGLVNLDYGRWEGLTPEEASTADPEAYDRYLAFSDDAACPDGELLLNAAERTLLSLHVLQLLHPGGVVVAVSHAVIVRFAIALVTDSPRPEWRRSLPNGSVTAFDVTSDTIRLVRAPLAVG
ncbi:MAG: putative phosphatase [Chloroflexota bacterium]|nr:putative phosphatase [Chloroflexota bacterium]